MTEKINIKAFISYSHKDKFYFTQFVNGLKSHSKLSKLFNWEFWDDREIIIGIEWHEQIQAQIKECDFAILLISADFLSSEYVNTDEIANFLKENKERGFLFFPILVRDCDWTSIQKISKVQFFLAHGEDYGFPKKDGQQIAYAELLRQDTEGALIKNASLDTFHKNIIKAIETAISKKIIQ